MDRESLCNITMNYFSNMMSTIQNIDEICENRIRHYRKKRKLCVMKINQLRRQQLLILLMAPHSLNSRFSWKLERTEMFWERDCQLNNDDFFKTNFRMHRNTFQTLCGMLKNLQKKDTNYRKSIPLEKRVAVALYALGSSVEYRRIGNLFGIGKSTVCKIVLDFCNEVWNTMKPLYLNHLPLSQDKVKEFVKGFETLGFPQCLGAIDGCHIEIHPHTVDAVDYFNNKGWYSTVLLALVDWRYRFMYINVGSPGRCSNSEIYENSLLKKHLTECTLLRQMTKRISEVNVPVFIMGDSAFRLSESLMNPYPFNIQSNEAQKNFNHALSKCRRVVENSFGHLKARFRRIGNGIDNTRNHASLIIKACCVLHNFLNEKNDKINDKWIQAQQSIEGNRQYPEQQVVLNDQECSAEEIRQAIASFISSRSEQEIFDEVEGRFKSLKNEDGTGRVEDDIGFEDNTWSDEFEIQL